MKGTALAAAVFFGLASTVPGTICPALSAGDQPDSGDLAPTPYRAAIDRIAAAIEALKPGFPQLVDFSPEVHRDLERLVISYGYRTHRAPRRGGWTSGVPNPDEDGIWFRIDFHDPASQSQIHTQPVVPRYRFRDLEVMFLILEGERTERLEGAIQRILLDNGVQALDGRAGSQRR